MESAKLAELTAVNFDLNRSLLQIQSAQITCKVIALESRIAVQTNNLAYTRYQQAQVSLALESVRSHCQRKPLMIATEVELPEPLFRRLLALLDANPTKSLDTLFAQALEAYLDQQSA